MPQTPKLCTLSNARRTSSSTSETPSQKPKKPTLSEQAKKLSAFAAWAKAQAEKNQEGVKDCLKLYGFDSIDSVTFDKIAAVTHAIQEL